MTYLKTYTLNGLTLTTNDLPDNLSRQCRNARLIAWSKGMQPLSVIMSPEKIRRTGRNAERIIPDENETLHTLEEVAKAVGCGVANIARRASIYGCDSPVVWIKGRLTPKKIEETGAKQISKRKPEECVSERGKKKGNWGDLVNKKRDYKLNDIKPLGSWEKEQTTNEKDANFGEPQTYVPSSRGGGMF